jgi:effector-binding domain-containing protein
MRIGAGYVLTLFFLSGCSVFGIRTAEEARYTVLVQDGEIQIRQYERLIAAQTEVEGDYDQTTSKAFKRLAGYIFGNNKKKQEISMTSPVLQERENEKLSMTAPVLQEKSGEKWTMAFVMPSKYTLETLPEPADPEVNLIRIPGKKVAAMRYSGFLTERRISEKAQELTAWLEEKGLKALSSPRSAGYDPPWTIPFLRRNEVHIDIE